MSLTASLTNAIAGLQVTQQGLSVVSRNVANAGVVGYHRQNLSVVDGVSGNSSDIRNTQVQRALDISLRSQTLNENAEYGYTNTTAAFLERVEALLGSPGDSNSINELYNEFTRSLEEMATSPDSFSTRADVINHAQSLAESLNYLSSNVQLLRQETEQQMIASVNQLNNALSSLAEINLQLSRHSADEAATNALLDDQDRLLGIVSTTVDIRVHERPLGGISIHTRSGLNLLDLNAPKFEFAASGLIGAETHFNSDATKNEVGTLTLRSSSGLSMDLVGQDIFQSGEMKALIDLRDGSLAGVQSQLDNIAAALSLALSTQPVSSVTATVGAANGFDIDVSGLQAGNAISLSYTEGGVDKNVSIVRVDDTTQLPMDIVGTNGVRTIGIDFSGGATAAAAAISTALGAGVTVSNTGGNVLRFLDDGVTNNTTMNTLNAGITVASLQSGDPALSLFTDVNSTFTGSLDGQDQKVGYAARIRVNEQLVLNNEILVKYSTSPATSIGDDTRPHALIDKLSQSQFVFGRDPLVTGGTTELIGSVSQLIEQSMNFQGSQVAAAKQSLSGQHIIMESLQARADASHGVDIDTEMAQLMQLQNAYGANARIISIVQEMMDRLLNI